MSDVSLESFSDDPFEEETLIETSAVNNQLPAAIDSEKALLGALLLNGHEVFPSIKSVLKAEHFFSHQHREIYKALLVIDSNNDPFDPITVSDVLARQKKLNRAGGQEYIIELATGAVLNVNVEHLANIIFERAMLRSIIDVSRQTIADSYSEDVYDSRFVLEKADQRLREIAENRPSEGGLLPMQELLDKTFTKLNEIKDNKGNITGITTGFKGLNEITSGWQSEDLVILAARPSMGKTALALSFLEHAARDKKSVLLFSMEMPSISITMRMISAMSKVELKKIREAKLDPQEWESVGKAIVELKRFGIFIDDSGGLTVTQLRDRVRRYARIHGEPDLILVDYLGLMQAPEHASNRVNEISYISGGLKQIARDYKCPVIALSQLSRAVEQRNSKKPVLADLRDSGSIEQDADLILFIYRDEYYLREQSKRKGIADIIIAKHRNGELGEVPLSFLAQYAQFSNYMSTAESLEE